MRIKSVVLNLSSFSFFHFVRKCMTPNLVIYIASALYGLIRIEVFFAAANLMLLLS